MVRLKPKCGMCNRNTKNTIILICYSDIIVLIYCLVKANQEKYHKLTKNEEKIYTTGKNSQNMYFLPLIWCPSYT